MKKIVLLEVLSTFSKEELESFHAGILGIMSF